MWKRAKQTWDPYGGTTRRRGARLGLLVAVLAVLPGLVAGTLYTTQATSGTLTSGVSPQAAGTCGFVQGPGWDTVGSGGSTAYISDAALPASGSPGIATTTVTVYEYETGSTGYQYMVGEVALDCNTGAASNLNGTISISGTAITGADWMTMTLSTVAPTTTNPTTSGTKCDTSGASAQGLYTYAGETASAQTGYISTNTPKNAYQGGTSITWSANASAFTDDACTTTDHFGASTNLITDANSATTCLFANGVIGTTPCIYIGGWSATPQITLRPANGLTNADVIWISFAWVAVPLAGTSGGTSISLAFANL